MIVYLYTLIYFCILFRSNKSNFGLEVLYICLLMFADVLDVFPILKKSMRCLDSVGEVGTQTRDPSPTFLSFI